MIILVLNKVLFFVIGAVECLFTILKCLGDPSTGNCLLVFIGRICGTNILVTPEKN